MQQTATRIYDPMHCDWKAYCYQERICRARAALPPPFKLVQQGYTFVGVDRRSTLPKIKYTYVSTAAQIPHLPSAILNANATFDQYQQYYGERSWFYLRCSIQDLEELSPWELQYCSPALVVNFEMFRERLIIARQKSQNEMLSQISHHPTNIICYIRLNLKAIQKRDQTGFIDVVLFGKKWKEPKTILDIYLYLKLFGKLWYLPMPPTNSVQAKSKWYMQRIDPAAKRSDANTLRKIRNKTQMAEYATFIHFLAIKYPLIFAKIPKLSEQQLSASFKKFVDMNSYPQPGYSFVQRYKKQLQHPYFKSKGGIFDEQKFRQANSQPLIGKCQVFSLSKEDQMAQLQALVVQNCVQEEDMRKFMDARRQRNNMMAEIYHPNNSSLTQVQKFMSVLRENNQLEAQQLLIKPQLQKVGHFALKDQRLTQEADLIRKYQEKDMVKIRNQLQREFREDVNLQSFRKSTQAVRSEQMIMNQGHFIQRSRKKEVYEQIEMQKEFELAMRQRNEQEQYVKKSLRKRQMVQIQLQNSNSEENPNSEEMQKVILEANEMKQYQKMFQKTPYAFGIDFLATQILYYKRNPSSKVIYYKCPRCGSWVSRDSPHKKCKPTAFNERLLVCQPRKNISPFVIELFRENNSQGLGLCMLCQDVFSSRSLQNHKCPQLEQHYFKHENNPPKFYGSMFPLAYRIGISRNDIFGVSAAIILNQQAIRPSMIHNVSVKCHNISPRIFADLIQDEDQNQFYLAQTRHGIKAIGDIPKGTRLGYVGGDIFPLTVFNIMKRGYITALEGGQNFDDFSFGPIQHFSGKIFLYLGLSFCQRKYDGNAQLRFGVLQVNGVCEVRAYIYFTKRVNAGEMVMIYNYERVTEGVQEEITVSEQGILQDLPEKFKHDLMRPIVIDASEQEDDSFEGEQNLYDQRQINVSMGKNEVYKRNH